MEKLAESELYLKELNRGQWNIGKAKSSFPVPGKRQDDVEVAIKMQNSWMGIPGYQNWMLRFTATVVMLIDSSKNDKKELSATFAYRQIAAVKVRNKKGKLEILLEDMTAISKDAPKKLSLYTPSSTESAHLVRTLYQNKIEADETELSVQFETGAEEFSFVSAKSSAKKAAGGEFGVSSDGDVTKAPRAKDAWGLDDEDEFADELMGKLNTVERQGKEMKGQFETSTKEMERQKSLVDETNQRTTILTSEVYKTDKFIGGKGNKSSGGTAAQAAMLAHAAGKL